MNAQLTFVHALSPLHAGIGQGAGVIDLPIAREKATGIPFLPGSSLKGALRTRAFNGDQKETYLPIFGPDNPAVEENRASLVQFSDQRLLLFPVRSLAGTFAWVTSPLVLRRLRREMEDTQIDVARLTIPEVPDNGTCLLARQDSALTWQAPNGSKEYRVYLEDLDLNARPDPNATAIWAEWLATTLYPRNQDKEWRDMLTTRLCLVHDDLFTFLVTNATEVTARIRLQEEVKTVQQGGLWYEEALPAESILSGLVLAMPSSKRGYSIQQILRLLRQLSSRTIQLGGKATVGRGLCRVQFAGQE
ncbi:type III-B CRISPR module RAMP protein Cmr4 [Ktedonospora formicarum]|uniref:Type III-B CRISPR module RAMP protein Cmr4 n=1 Tax=Ktedonospora formicarum TaxID=2778364 RepID=A0A8J3MUS7_9CHLR|nr:type III-B CRISPR module RAMP protein Cmr4 [Ktedonospora formicarum]GHO49662.1 type III-B CRISPR module RAMP protein Cmr4 [Ktedonospora formicarum]